MDSIYTSNAFCFSYDESWKRLTSVLHFAKLNWDLLLISGKFQTNSIFNHSIIANLFLLLFEENQRIECCFKSGEQL